MANPMDRLGYEEIAALTVTYAHNNTIVYDDQEDGGSAQVGLAVTLSADDEAGLVGDGEAVLGKLILVEDDGYCTVQVGGYMTLPGGSGATLTLGKKIVGDLGAASAEGYIREVATGTAAELGVARGFIQNNDDTAAVIVFL